MCCVNVFVVRHLLVGAVVCMSVVWLESHGLIKSSAAPDIGGGVTKDSLYRWVSINIKFE